MMIVEIKEEYLAATATPEQRKSLSHVFNALKESGEDVKITRTMEGAGDGYVYYAVSGLYGAVEEKAANAVRCMSPVSDAYPVPDNPFQAALEM